AGEWVELFRDAMTHYDRPDEVKPIDPNDESDWRSARGDWSRVSDLAAMLERELAEKPWREVLVTWWPRLITGVGSGLTHGLLRTFHAVRGLERAERAGQEP